jgi:hypothetical protein
MFVSPNYELPRPCRMSDPPQRRVVSFLGSTLLAQITCATWHSAREAGEVNAGPWELLTGVV